MLNQIWFRALIIFTLGFTTYSFMLGAPFKTLDDQVSIADNPIIQDTLHIKEIFTQGYFKDHTFYRPLVNISYMLEYQQFGPNSFFYNLDNLFLHILNACWVWWLVVLLTESPLIGFWAGLLFMIHPIHVEAVANISGRAILLSANFVLLTFISWVYYLRLARVRFLVLSLMTFILGILCKESSAVLPGVLFLYLWQKKKPLVILWPFAVIVAMYILLRRSLGITQVFPWQNLTEHVLGVGSFLHSVLTGLGLFIFPVNLHFDRSQRLIASFADPEFFITMALWVVFLISLWVWRKHIKPMSWFCLGWIAIELFPVSQIVTTIGVQPGRISTADHFLYLVSVPVFIFLVKAWNKIWQINQEKQWTNPNVLKMAVGGFLLFLFLFNIEQNYYSRNDFVMLKRSLEIQPENARLQSSLGLKYVEQGKFDRAEECFLRAVLGEPMSPRYQIQLAQSICDQGRYQECLDIYNRISNPGTYEQMLKDNKEKAMRLLKDHVSVPSK